MHTINTILIGTIGAWFAWFFGAPVPFLTGPALLVTVSTLLFNFSCYISPQARNISFLVIGVSAAEGINSEVIKNVMNWPISLLGMILSMIVVIFLGKYIFHNFFKMDINDAILASAPGHLSFVLSLSEYGSGKTIVISVIQSIRVLTLTLAIPASIVYLTDVDLQKTIPSESFLSYSHLIILLFFSGLIGLILSYFKAPAAFLIAGMFTSTIGHGFDVTPGAVPEFLTILAFIILGSLIGSRFNGISLTIFKSCVIQGLIFTLLSLSVAIFTAYIIATITGFNLTEVLIAIAPGGLETMVIMGQLIGADPAFVTFHHLTRLFVLPFILTTVIKK